VIVPSSRPGSASGTDALLAALRAAYGRGARLISFCTGAFLLAAARLLDGRRATTHWLWTGELQARYPNVRVDPGVLYVDEGQVPTPAWPRARPWGV
jgi:AraC family transcriptional activator FtrA